MVGRPRGDDRELVERFTRICRGVADQDDWDRLHHQVVFLIHSTAFRITGDYQLSEDLTQEVMLVVRQRAASFAFRPGLDVVNQAHCVRAWLIRITANQAINAARRIVRHPVIEGGEREAPDASGIAEDEHPQTSLRHAIHELPEHLRLPLILRFFEGSSLQQIASALDVSVSCAQKRVEAAVQLLRRHLVRDGISGALCLSLLHDLAQLPREVTSAAASADALVRAPSPMRPLPTAKPGAAIPAWLIGLSVILGGVLVLVAPRLLAHPAPVPPIATASTDGGPEFFDPPYRPILRQGRFVLDAGRLVVTGSRDLPLTDGSLITPGNNLRWQSVAGGGLGFTMPPGEFSAAVLRTPLPPGSAFRLRVRTFGVPNPVQPGGGNLARIGDPGAASIDRPADFPVRAGEPRADLTPEARDLSRRLTNGHLLMILPAHRLPFNAPFATIHQSDQSTMDALFAVRDQPKPHEWSFDLLKVGEHPSGLVFEVRTWLDGRRLGHFWMRLTEASFSSVLWLHSAGQRLERVTLDTAEFEAERPQGR